MSTQDNKIRHLETTIEDIAIPSITSLVAISNPYIGVVALFIFGSLKVIRKWQNDRVVEVLKAVGEERLMELLNGDDKSRDILHRVLLNILDEQSIAKRQLFYEYLIKVHNNVRPSFDYHTKIILTINSITFEELETLLKLNNGYKEVLLIASKQKDAGNPETFTKERGVSVTEIKISQILRIEELKLETAMENLSSYGLIYTRPGRFNGTFYLPLTEFGEVFLEFITK